MSKFIGSFLNINTYMNININHVYNVSGLPLLYLLDIGNILCSYQTSMMNAEMST